MTWLFPGRAIKVKSQKRYENTYVFSSPKACAICVYSTALVLEETFAQTAFAVVSRAYPGMSEFYSPVASIWQTRMCDIPGAHLQGSKTCNGRDIRAEPQLVSSLVTCALSGLCPLLQAWVCVSDVRSLTFLTPTPLPFSLNILRSDFETFASYALRLLLKLQIECFKLYKKCLKN